MTADSPAQTILDLLTSQRERRGPAVALMAPGRQPVSYAALHAAVERAGETLTAIGLGRGHRIAVALPDGLDAAIGIVAAMACSTCAPLSRSLDRDTSTSLFARLRIDALIVAEDDASPVGAAAAAAGVPVVRLSPGAGLLAPRADPMRPPVARTRPRPDDVALLMQTSGTTSGPKIVPLTHRAVLWAARQQPLVPGDRFLCVSPLRTKSGLGLGVLAPLAAGASTVLTPGFDAAVFFRWLAEFNATCFSASPTVHASILDELRSRAPVVPASLRFVRSSSNGMSGAMQEALESALGVPVIQGYGSTEGGLIAQDSLPPGRRRAGSVGIPRGTDITIRGERGDDQPAGSVGEILVRGPAVFRGYECDPEANRLAFDAHWFRTGDLGRFDADGYLFIVGRVSELINRGGLKISPAEVDAVLMRHPAVRDAATAGVSHPTLGEDVVSAVILHDGASIKGDELRDHAIRHLAPFMVPSSVLPVGEFPRNALGKVRREALADLLRERLRTDIVPLRDAEEELIAGIFESLLDVHRVGAHDNFFALGGDSLRSVQALARICAQTGVEMDPLALFEGPTVEQLAQRLRTTRAAPLPPATAAPPLVRRARRK
ncbi:MAG: non-ribosomal peptide synthetase, partial [Betaproteobacteria bacterium]